MSNGIRFLALLGMILVVGLVVAVWYEDRDAVLDAKIEQIDHNLDGIKGDRKLAEANRKLDAIEAALQKHPVVVLPKRNQVIAEWKAWGGLLSRLGGTNVGMNDAPGIWAHKQMI